ncbi:MAG: phosphoribosylanthranilate isomerase [Nitrospirota bacterium]
MVRVKICGITNLDDAVASARYGADGIGFIFYKKSARYIEPDKAREIIAHLSPFLTTFAVVVNEEKKIVREIIAHTGVNIIQLHGDESPEFCNEFSERAVKAIRIRNKESLNIMDGFHVRGFLLDTFRKGGYGGTGEIFDWDIAIEAKRFGDIILSGGLTIDNIREAIAKVRPYGVDVSSSVESNIGKKDHKILREFIERAKGVK